ncbi:MAG: hypothetical protein ACTSYD_11990 [Candidatus Heimdallarchaeaceae archaeon]
MPVYTSIHFNISGFLEPCTQDELNIFNQILYRFGTDQKLKGVISVNSLLLKSLIWQDISIIKHISKLLTLTKKFELASSTYSNFMSMDFIEETPYIEQGLIDESFKLIKRVYPNQDIKGFYFPLGTWDSNYLLSLEKNKIKFLIVDWKIIEQSLKLNGNEEQLFQPFRLKNSEIKVLPSCNFNSFQYFIPEAYYDYLTKGEINKFSSVVNYINKISEEQDNNYFSILTIDLNDVRFPKFDSNFQISNFLRDTSVLLGEKLVSTLPDEIDDKFDSLPEIELISNILPYEIDKEMTTTNSQWVLCKEFCNKLFTTRNIIKNAINILNQDGKNKLEYFFKHAYLTAHHNYCFATLGIPLKSIDINKIFAMKGALQQLSQLAEIISSGTSQQQVKTACTSESRVGRFAIYNNKFIALFNVAGGSLSSFIDLEKGNVISYTLVPGLEIDSETNEPIAGMMHDVVSRHYWGQFNLFNETYYPSITNTEKEPNVMFSCYPIGNILLTKSFIIDSSSRQIKVNYTIINKGSKEDKFNVYSYSKLNLGAFQYDVLTPDDLAYLVSEETTTNTISLINKILNIKVDLVIPKVVMFNVSKGFMGFDIGLQFGVKALNQGENITYPILIKY